ncbi:MAG TPA: metallophosphoesterase family protein [Kofleriaceae bacterium]|nr:metallophosphoesterase family protein [Kofleriaceae bacterium]
MRALLIGDIHTEAVLLRKVIAHGRRVGVDAILSVGDIVDGPGDPHACIAQLRAEGALVVRGNHERWLAEGCPMEPYPYQSAELEWLTSLPATREIDTPTGRALLVHGVGADDSAELDPYTRDRTLESLEPLWQVVRAGEHRWMIGGHTHRAMVRTIEQLTIVNPGTLVLEQDPSFVVADFASGDLEYWTLLPSLQRRATWSARSPADADWNLITARARFSTSARDMDSDRR